MSVRNIFSLCAAVTLTVTGLL